MGTSQAPEPVEIGAEAMIYPIVHQMPFDESL